MRSHPSSLQRPLPEHKTTQLHREGSKKPQLRVSLDGHALGSLAKDHKVYVQQSGWFQETEETKTPVVDSKL